MGEAAQMAMTVTARGMAATPWLRGRAPVVVAALAIGAAIAATLHASQRSDAADVPRSVMLERDLSDLRPRAFKPVAAPAARVERAASSEATEGRVPLEASVVHPEPAPNAVPPNAKPRVVRIASVTANAAAPVERVAQVEPAERGAAPAAIARAPSYDRVLAFSDALARCGEETYFARLVCEERARSRFCNGAGDLPQCASAPPRDYGN